MSYSGAQRLIGLDILRGFAVFGVLLVNAPSMNSPVVKDGVDFAFKNGFANQWYADFILTMAAGKFYPIFAFIFGVSAAIFLSKHGPKLYLRRMLMLLVFGLCQGLLIWWGDVLAIYAVLGWSLTFLAGRSKELVRRVFYLSIVLAIVASVSLYLVGDGSDFYPAVDSLRAYQNTSFLVVSQQRALDYMWTYVPWAIASIDVAQFLHTSIFIIELFLCFAAGFYCHLSGLLNRILIEKNMALRIFSLSLLCSIVIKLISKKFVELDDIFIIAECFLQAMSYASFVLLLCHYDLAQRLLKPLAFVGRMSLSNYLCHNLSLSLVLYGYGLGLYGTIGPFDQLPLLLSLMAFSLMFSCVWLQYFQFGPLEWIWRIATYGSDYHKPFSTKNLAARTRAASSMVSVLNKPRSDPCRSKRAR